MSERLPARLEAAALMRRAEAAGGFATIIHRGDPDRGQITLLVAERGRTAAVLERQMAPDFTYRWAETESAQAVDEMGVREFARKKRRFDPDLWLIELDVADAQRFIAEMLASP